MIPVYNEERTLRDLVDRVCAVPIRKELILVDDCSNDGTRAILQELAKNPEPDPLNMFSITITTSIEGKGGALTTGFQHAQRRRRDHSGRRPGIRSRRNIPRLLAADRRRQGRRGVRQPRSWATIRIACSTSGTPWATNSLTTLSNCSPT